VTDPIEGSVGNEVCYICHSTVAAGYVARAPRAATRQTAEYVGIADRLARCFPDRRDPTKLSDMIRARTFAISCGYEDADDFMRTDPAFKLACGKLPDAGSDCVRRRRCRG
jgi:hypothetical protein